MKYFIVCGEDGGMLCSADDRYARQVFKNVRDDGYEIAIISSGLYNELRKTYITRDYISKSLVRENAREEPYVTDLRWLNWVS